MPADHHYLEQELIGLLRTDATIFEFLQRTALDGLWFWDLETPGVGWVNEGFWQLLGYNPATEKPAASEWENSIHPDDLCTAK